MAEHDKAPKTKDEEPDEADPVEGEAKKFKGDDDGPDDSGRSIAFTG